MKIEQRLAPEAEMVGMRAKGYRAGIVNYRGKEMEGNSPYRGRRTSEFINPLVDKIEAFLEKSKKTKD